MSNPLGIEITAKLNESASTKKLQDSVNNIGKKIVPVEVPFQFDLKDSTKVKEQMAKLVADITNNKGNVISYKLNVDEKGNATNGVVKFRNELNQATTATLQLNEESKKWSVTQQSISQNIEQTIKANEKLIQQQLQLKESAYAQNNKNSGTYWQGQFADTVKSQTSTSDISQQMKAYYEEEMAEANKLQKLKDSFNSKNLNGIDAEIKKRELASSQFSKQIQAQMQAQVNLEKEQVKANTLNQNQSILQMKSSQLDSRIKSWMNENTRAAKIYDNQLQQILLSTKEINNQADLTKATQQFRTLQRQAEAAGHSGQTALQKFGSDFKNFLTFLSAGTLLMSGVNTIRSMVSSITELDASMVELRKVTDETEATYNSFYHSANNTAKALGVTTKSVIDATATWAQMGYSIQDAAKLAKSSEIFSNISENMDVNDATSTLISSIKAFGLDANDVLD